MTTSKAPQGDPQKDGPARQEAAPTQYVDWLTSSISRYEELAKSLVRHKGEKGRIVEGVVKTALRSVLPGRFSIGTGFAITASGKISSQLDLILYDCIENAPIILEGGTGLFPIECIYGFVEVKSLLNGNEIDGVTAAITTVRSFTAEKRYVTYGAGDLGQGKKVVEEHEFEGKLAPRSFVFAIDSDFGSLPALVEKLKAATERDLAHVHGLAVIEKNWFAAQKAHEKPHEFICKEGHALADFCASVLDSVQSIEMHPASMKRYLGIRA